jgi:hypothetical protein
MARPEPAPITEAPTIASTRCAAPDDRGDRLETCALRSDDTEARNNILGCFGRSDRSAPCRGLWPGRSWTDPGELDTPFGAFTGPPERHAPPG